MIILLHDKTIPMDHEVIIKTLDIEITDQEMIITILTIIEQVMTINIGIIIDKMRGIEMITVIEMITIIEMITVSIITAMPTNLEIVPITITNEEVTDSIVLPLL